MHPSRRRRPRLIPGLCFVFVGGLFALPSPAQIAMETVAEPVDQTSTVTEPEQVDTTTPDPAPRRPDRRDDLWRWVDGDYALRDLHDRAQDQGFTYTFLLGTMTQFNFRGGANTHNAHETGGRAFHIVEVDLDKLGILPGATIFARGLQTFNSGIQGDVGSLTPPFFALGSSGDNEILLDKYWYRQRLFDDRLEFRLGKLLNFTDLFDRNIYADNYVNSFMNRALNHNMTMPTSLALGAFVKFWPTDWLYMQAAAIDAEPDNDRNRRGTGDGTPRSTMGPISADTARSGLPRTTFSSGPCPAGMRWVDGTTGPSNRFFAIHSADCSPLGCGMMTRAFTSTSNRCSTRNSPTRRTNRVWEFSRVMAMPRKK
jgi:hypothetical protein